MSLERFSAVVQRFGERLRPIRMVYMVRDWTRCPWDAVEEAAKAEDFPAWFHSWKRNLPEPLLTSIPVGGSLLEELGKRSDIFSPRFVHRLSRCDASLERDNSRV